MLAGTEAARAAVRCSCPVSGSASRRDCSAAGAATPEGSRGEADTEDDRRAGPRDYASADTGRDCWADLAGPADCRSRDTEPSASNFLVNTEIEVDMGPSCTLHAAACEAKAGLDSPAHEAAAHCCSARDSSSARPSARPDCVAAAAEVLAASDYSKVAEASADFVLENSKRRRKLVVEDAKTSRLLGDEREGVERARQPAI